MNERQNTNCSTTCPRTCSGSALLEIASSIAHAEDALACILNAECAKINAIAASYSDLETLLAVDTSVQATLERITALEGVLQAKLNAILPFLTDNEL